MGRTTICFVLSLFCAACATGGSGRPTVPVAADPSDRCVHGVACETCVKCHPELAARFKAAGDWCPEHGVPETQCGLCHPEVVIAPPLPPAGADVLQLVADGHDVATLEPVPGKVTLFDFHADWCGPCRRVDEHVFALMAKRSDLAVRKLNVVSWESPLAKHWLASVSSLPYVIVHGKDGKPVGTMAGLKLDELDRAIAVGGR